MVPLRQVSLKRQEAESEFRVFVMERPCLFFPEQLISLLSCIRAAQRLTATNAQDLRIFVLFHFISALVYFSFLVLAFHKCLIYVCPVNVKLVLENKAGQTHR